MTVLNICSFENQSEKRIHTASEKRTATSIKLNILQIQHAILFAQINYNSCKVLYDVIAYHY